MYLIPWLLLKHTSQAPAGVAQGDPQGGLLLILGYY